MFVKLLLRMEEIIPLPSFIEDRRIPTKPIHLARFSRDGALLAIIHTDLSLSIWDSEDILVNTFEYSFFETRTKNRGNSHHIVFLDWSATNKYLYLIVDRIGFQIDVYTKPKEPHRFTYIYIDLYILYRFDQPLNSFSAHPTVDHLCIATCMDELIELYITEKEQSMRFKYRGDIKSDTNRKSSILSYAEYTNIDGTILFWVQSFLYLLKPKQPIDYEQPVDVISSTQIKSSQPLQQRIRIDAMKKRCIIACRNEITMYSLPLFEVEWSYRDTVNDSPWKAIDYFSKDNLVLALPEVYVSEGPVFYLLPTEGKADSQIYRNPQEKLCWAIIHPRGNTLLFCDDDGEIVLFTREKEEFTWSVGHL